MANWDEAWEEAAAYAPTDETYIDTLEITNTDLTTPIRVCNSYERLDVGGMHFQPFYFDITLPEVAANSVPQLQVQIGNFSTELRAALRLIKSSTSSTTVKYRQYRITANGTAILGDYMDLPLPVATITIPTGGEMITVICEPTNIVNLPLHRQFYTTARFPGLKA